MLLSFLPDSIITQPFADLVGDEDQAGSKNRLEDSHCGRTGKRAGGDAVAVDICIESFRYCRQLRIIPLAAR